MDRSRRTLVCKRTCQSRETGSRCMPRCGRGPLTDLDSQCRWCTHCRVTHHLVRRRSPTLRDGRTLVDEQGPRKCSPLQQRGFHPIPRSSLSTCSSIQAQVSAQRCQGACLPRVCLGCTPFSGMAQSCSDRYKVPIIFYRHCAVLHVQTIEPWAHRSSRPHVRGVPQIDGARNPGYLGIPQSAIPFSSDRASSAYAGRRSRMDGVSRSIALAWSSVSSRCSPRRTQTSRRIT